MRNARIPGLRMGKGILVFFHVIGNSYGIPWIVLAFIQKIQYNIRLDCVKTQFQKSGETHDYIK